MSKIKNDLKDFHDEPKLYWFSKLLEIGKLPVFKHFGLLISLLFIRIAPEIPINLKNSYTGLSGKRAGIIGFTVTLFFTFIINIIWTFFTGTFTGTDSTIIYFIDDWWNLVLYSIICPTYVGLTCWLAAIVIKGWSEINDFKENEIAIISKSKKFKLFKTVTLGVLILSIAFALTTNYINDIVRVAHNNKYYWFLSKDEHELGALGVYYFLLNFSLLIVTLIALTLFMSIYSLIMDVGRALELKKDIGRIQFETLKIKLSAFTEAYMVTKGIIACYIVNIWIWVRSPLGRETQENFIIALIFLTIIGVFLVSFPRYFVELQWVKLKIRSRNNDKILDTKYEDLRTFQVKNIAHILDYIFIGGFLIYAIQYIFGLN